MFVLYYTSKICVNIMAQLPHNGGGEGLLGSGLRFFNVFERGP